MQRVSPWLTSGARFASFLKWLPLLVVLDCVLTFGGIALVETFSTGAYAENGDTIVKTLPEVGLFLFALELMLLTPLLEEFVFRLLPLICLSGLTFSVFGRPPQMLGLTLYVLVTSVLFGLAHGSAENILTQGVSGFMYAVVFLKLSAAGRHPVKGYAASMVMHGSFNGSLIPLILLGI